jgi:cell division protein FtsL
MNAAARLVHHGVWSRHFSLTHWLTKQRIMMIFLSLAVLMSAIGTIYAAHVTRMMHAAYQRNMIEHHQLLVKRGQLLLEKSTQLVQARIQIQAENKLNMTMPNYQSIRIIYE